MIAWLLAGISDNLVAGNPGLATFMKLRRRDYRSPRWSSRRGRG
jgi:hypothetical protein